jgi:hypothetical protein
LIESLILAEGDKMFKRIIVLLIITMILMAGCTSDAVPRYEEPVNTGRSAQHGRVPEMEEPANNPGQQGEEPNTVQEPAQQNDSNHGNGEIIPVQPELKPLISNKETVRMFLEAWRDNDLEQMNMLTVKPLEDFFRNSDILFSSYHHLDMGNLAEFVREGLDTISVYDENAFNDIEIMPLASAEGSGVLVRLGQAFYLHVSLSLEQGLWKMKAIDSSPSYIEKAVPSDWAGIDNTTLADVTDTDGDRYPEMLTTGIWGEWEGIGPEPSNAIGVYSFGPDGYSKTCFLDMNQRLNDNRVIIGTAIGTIYGDGTDIVIAERTANDDAELADTGTLEHYLSVYRPSNGRLDKVEEIEWKSVIISGMENGYYAPEWIELLGVKAFKDGSTQSIVLKAGLNAVKTDERLIDVIEGIFILSIGDDGWETDWYHLGLDGEYHTVVFDTGSDGGKACKLYYIEDSFDGPNDGYAYEVYNEQGKWIVKPVLSQKLDLLAAADIDGDGTNELLVRDQGLLKIFNADGQELVRIELPRGTKEVPFAWMGVTEGRQMLVAALHRGSYAYWKSQIIKWEGTGLDLGVAWSSEDLGTEGISSMKVYDVNGDNRPEILASFSNNYLIRGQFFKVFEP